MPLNESEKLFEQFEVDVAAIENAYLNIREHLDSVLNEAVQLNIWLFLATLACAGLPAGLYKNFSFIAVLIVMIYQIDTLVKYRLNIPLYRVKIDNLQFKLKTLKAKLAALQADTSPIKTVLTVEINSAVIGWRFIAPFILNFLFLLMTASYFKLVD